MGGNLSLIQEQLFRKVKRNYLISNGKTVINDDKHCCTHDEQIDDTILTSETGGVTDSLALSDDKIITSAP